MTTPTLTQRRMMKANAAPKSATVAKPSPCFPPPPPVPARLDKMAYDAETRRPVAVPPGTKVRVHITGWRYDEQPAEVVSDNMARMDRAITAKRRGRGDREEFATVKLQNASLWRDH